MDVGKMDQTWVPSMPPLLSSDLDSIWTTWKKLWHCALTRKILKRGKKLVKKIKRGKLGQWLYTNNFEKLHKCYKGLLNSRHSG